MTWKTNLVIFVACDDSSHEQDPVSRIEGGFDADIPKAMAAAGWSYNHAKQFHRCPTCTARWKRRN